MPLQHNMDLVPSDWLYSVSTFVVWGTPSLGPLERDEWNKINIKSSCAGANKVPLLHQIQNQVKKNAQLEH